MHVSSNIGVDVINSKHIQRLRLCLESEYIELLTAASCLANQINWPFWISAVYVVEEALVHKWHNVEISRQGSTHTPREPKIKIITEVGETHGEEEVRPESQNDLRVHRAAYKPASFWKKVNRHYTLPYFWHTTANLCKWIAKRRRRE